MPRKSSTKFMSTKQEQSVAKEMGGKPVIASGALWSAKGDVRSDKFLVECKTTSKSFYSLGFATWDKISREAVRDGLRIPVMCIDLNDGKDRMLVADFKQMQGFYYFETYADWEETSFSAHSTVRVTPVSERVIMIQRKDFTFLIIPWDNFLKIIEGEKDFWH